jgi:hypothetical protein
MPDKPQEAQNSNENKPKIDPRQDPQNNPCSLCRPYGPICKGHGGGGGGGGSGGGDNSQSGNSGEASTNDYVKGTPETASYAINTDSDAANTNTTAYAKENLTSLQSSAANSMLFNSEVISDLLAKNLLLIDSNNELGILSIKCNPELLSKDQKNDLKKFIDVLLKELDAFKKEKGISANCVTINKDHAGNIVSLRITLPKPAMYDSFIQRLVNKNILPAQVQQKNDKAQYQEGINHFHPTPLLMKPTPAIHHKKDEEKTSTIRPKSPLDGLKPKGWT